MIRTLYVNTYSCGLEASYQFVKTKTEIRKPRSVNMEGAILNFNYQFLSAEELNTKTILSHNVVRLILNKYND